VRAILILSTCLGLLAACAGVPASRPDILILGEQHDAPGHQRLHRRTVEALAGRGQLAAVALEMALSGHSTRGLAPDAGDAQVRAALAWDDKGWPWAAYGPIVMAAVRAGIPVAGANLPPAGLREAARDAHIDSTVPAAALQAQVDDVREGHCGLLPESQLLPMARMQVARDAELARVTASLVVPGKTVVLVTGGRHADPQLGVPLHLPADLHVQSRIWPPQPPARDYCDELRRQWKGGAAAPRTQ
jgi:uncharacterized iron-regulated protein